MGNIFGFIQSYVSIPGLLLFALGVALIIVKSKFNLPAFVPYLGILFTGSGLIFMIEAACTMSIP